MKILVKTDGKREFLIFFPSRLIFNPLIATCAAGIINKSLRDKGILDCDNTAEQLRRLSRIIMKYKRRHPGWNLIEVNSKEGDNVIVRL